MKNQIIVLSVIFVMGMFVASCGSKSATTASEPATTENAAVDTTGTSKPMADVYQCPMKCEGEKTYDQLGKCPKCKMDLKKKDEHEGHEH